MKDKKLVFKITNEQGQDIEYEELYTFKNEKTGKSYMVYTDNSIDEDGKVRVFASIYSPSLDDKKLRPIENDDEWDFVEETINTLQGNDV